MALWFTAARLAGMAQAADATTATATAPDATATGTTDAALAQRAMTFLRAHMPEKDRQSLPAGYLEENVALAMQARARFPWAARVPEALFLNDVVPYAVLDETREPWRKGFFELAAPMVANAGSASEAARILNRDFFNKINVHYDTGRRSPNQSPAESMAQGKASCTGLSIILVDACRAVGIPARIAGVASWTTKPGNHTWVEIWDNGWHFTGADEATPDGLDHAWFTADAALAIQNHSQHAIHASSWEKTGKAFPLAWRPDDTSVPALDVTARYTGNKQIANTQPAAATLTLNVLLLERRGGPRIVARLEARDRGHEPLATATTKAGRTDMNDMAQLVLPAASGVQYLRATQDGATREWPFEARPPGVHLLELDWSAGTVVPPVVLATEAWLSRPEAGRGPAPDQPLGKTEATRILDLLWSARQISLRRELQAEMQKHEVVWQDKRMRWLERTFGTPPPAGRKLWISLHGGGNAPPAINDAQWQNQIRLYTPAEGIVVAPRAPTDTWNLWHENHIDPLMERLVAGMVALRGVNPDQVYLLGYSAGGDGVYQLAPRTADRWAAAAMMAGHPNEAKPLGLRNLPFAIFVGAEDAGYNRNTVAADWGKQLDTLEAANPGNYVHRVNIYPGMAHWMLGKDAEALPWMAGFSRQAWPVSISWLQDDTTHDRLYWLALPAGGARKDQIIQARVDGQTIHIDAAPGTTLTLYLSDTLLDLDQPVVVRANHKLLPGQLVPRHAGIIAGELARRADPRAAACARLTVVTGD